MERRMERAKMAESKGQKYVYDGRKRRVRDFRVGILNFYVLCGQPD